MSYAIEGIARALKKARENKSLSQRALSKRAGVPQSHISKIESGTVDLRLSSLIELARVLDLELVLAPRKTAPAIRSIVRASAASTPPDTIAAKQALKEFRRAEDALADLPKAIRTTSPFAQLQQRLRDLQHFPFDKPALQSIRDANTTLEALKGNDHDLEAIKDLNSKLTKLRNALAHQRSRAQQIETIQPAYSLDDEDDDA